MRRHAKSRLLPRRQPAQAPVKLALDAIFGVENCRNEIIWRYKTGGVSKRWFSRKRDTILFYSESSDYSFHPQR